ncbi:MAG: hypothetical protein ACREOD_05930 [Candidatus Dormibacteria bacterium]
MRPRHLIGFPTRILRGCCCLLPGGCCLIWVGVAAVLALLLALRVLGRL